MDTIIEGYLDRFADEFGLNKGDKSTNFEKLCYYSILNNELNYLDDNDLYDVSVGKNKGIDGICFAIDGQILTSISEIEDLRDSQKNFSVTAYFIQAKTSSKFEDSEIANFCDTVIDFLKDKPEYDLTDKAKEYHNIFIELLKLFSYIKNFDCKLFYCSTGKWNNDTSCSTTVNIKTKLLKASGKFKDDANIEITPVDSEKLRKLYDKATNPLNTQFVFSRKTPLEKIKNVKESYIGILPFSEFKKIIIDSETDKLKPLFSDNVRDFLGFDAKVNDNINRTLNDKEFELFQLLNNGITIIAEERKGYTDEFYLSNYQIVNGCQTSNILFSNRKLDGIEGLLIPIKLIITDNEDIRDKIIVSTNNQTQIKEEQLLALTSFQKELEAFYKNMGDGMFYERRKSQYSYDPSIKKKAIIDIREQIKTYVAMFLEEPHVVSGYFGKVYKERSGQIFLRNHKPEPYYLSGLTHYKFKTFINAKKIDRKYNKARYHIFMLFRKITEPDEKVEPASNKIKKYCEAIVKILRDDKKCLKNFQNAIEIIDTSSINVEDPKEIYKKSTTNALIEEFKKRYK